MTLVLSLHEIIQKDRSRISGKGFALAMLQRGGMQVPEALCISTEAYQEYVASTGLRDQIHMEIYKQDCIPFAHGMRLFGKIYNDIMKPEDPFQFTALLAGSKMVSVRRNQMLEDLAELIRKDPSNKDCILARKEDDLPCLLLQDQPSVDTLKIFSKVAL